MDLYYYCNNGVPIIIVPAGIRVRRINEQTEKRSWQIRGARKYFFVEFFFAYICNI